MLVITPARMTEKSHLQWNKNRDFLLENPDFIQSLKSIDKTIVKLFYGLENYKINNVFSEFKDEIEILSWSQTAIAEMFGVSAANINQRISKIREVIMGIIDKLK